MFIVVASRQLRYLGYDLFHTFTMEGPLQTEGHPNFNDKNGTRGIEESVTSTFSGLNLDPNQPISFSDANAESERNGDDQHTEHRVINDQLEIRTTP